MPGDLQLIANGNISPATFVKLDGSNDDYVLQATAGSGSHGDPTIGISGTDTDRAPLSDLITTQYHAQQGEPCRVFRAGEICLLTLGTGGATPGERLKSDASGNGIAVTTDADFAGAVALETGASGTQIRVAVLSPQQQAAA